MNVFCKPLKCLSFLSGRRPAEDYDPIDEKSSPAVPGGDDDEDDFFGDDWGPPSAGSSAKKEVVMSQSVERNPSRETTTKRGSGSSAASPASTSASSAAAKPAVGKKSDDFFSELGMEPEYRAPRVASQNKLAEASPAAAATPGKSVSTLLEEGGDGGEDAGGWGDDELDLKL
mmetsp:Transcript_120838/g.225952  ORF Transcript_120838/g.225952 Transcript_120838/m.225952 type:complete len:173 (+) Transcript_120838:115-633(+)